MRSIAYGRLMVDRAGLPQSRHCNSLQMANRPFAPTDSRAGPRSLANLSAGEMSVKHTGPQRRAIPPFVRGGNVQLAPFPFKGLGTQEKTK